MELSPKTYRYIVRPKWFSNYLFNKSIGSTFNFTNKNILDFGCGIGAYSVMFHPKNYIGIDKNEQRINYAKQLYPNHNFLSLKGNILPLPDASIDFIIIISVLHHIPSKTISNYLQEFRRVLKQTGIILIIEPCMFINSKLSNWAMLHLDKGNFIRMEKEYVELFQQSNYNTKTLKKYKQLVLYNKILIIASPILCHK
ncbi:MAG: hypothetical protein K0S01_4032 [Herbinix sp.]|nr:hypothetical protein [Herbinix sp.]